ncbi:Calcineurin-like phosphoesterase [Tangfeifania diversioriginum]|uniref:Calcineurin-like phosphoesterase n=1 Tax=Tangfeifania diversioriginum TaxID=1168035 RepID=A0A1M6HNP8_9BACT|nr:metallophosphoesterase [Tangfeifania diversioriginum]SHJ23763.1 Calcineurin-like phosphoesterase [Tangfeifania diversioriginum]
MNRRNFISIAGLTGTGLLFDAFSPAAKQKKLKDIRGTFSTLKNNISIFTKADVKSTHISHITDTHLSIDDKRGEKYLEFSRRMAGAYKSNIHFQSGESYSTKDSFEWTLKRAKEEKADLLALTGDIFSFPSEAAVEWVQDKLNETGIPFVYVAGNHDWHYEGMSGSSMKLRNIWTEKHLKAMYQGNNPLFASYDLNGIRFVCIDNSTYEILPQQLQFFKDMVNSGLPLILLMHIPLYMPGRPVGYGCAHPEWGENTDKNFDIERREKWRKGGHTKVTFDFYNEVFRTPNLLTILTGHIHQSTIDVKNGIPQVVSNLNATGYYSDIRISTL